MENSRNNWSSITLYTATYGFDSLGIPYDESHTYFPQEKVELPEGVNQYNFIIIRLIDKNELEKRIKTLLNSGVALSSEQVLDVVTLINNFSINLDINEVKNKEVKIVLWLALKNKGYINVDEFLRALTYLVTGNTLVVRSYRNHQNIKALLAYNKDKRTKIADLLNWYTKEFGIENIAGSFLRNRMVFLSFKCPETKRLINKINRKADRFNRPLEPDRLSEEDITNANVFQLIKYWNYCNSMLNPTKDKLYQIRNGKNYLAENNNYNISGRVKEEIDTVFTSYKNLIELRLKELLKHLEGKNVVIPDYIDYKVPSSLKRLASGVPEGTVVTFGEGKPFVVGIHWENHEDRRVDLDLHVTSRSFSGGWNSSFRGEGGSILYTGDMTDAPISRGGASEAWKFEGTFDEPLVVTLNDYTQLPVTPYKFVFDLNCSSKYFTDSEKNKYGSIFSGSAKTLNAKVTKERGQNTLGVIIGGKFYFLNSSIFSRAVTQRSELLKRLAEYYAESQKYQLSLTTLLELVGCNVYRSVEEVPTHLGLPENDSEIAKVEKDPYIDLSLEAITEDSFPKLFTNIEE